MIDFNGSYLYWQTKENSRARFSLESVLNIRQTRTETRTFILSTGVYACNMYAAHDLFHQPSYFYQFVYGESTSKIMRSYSIYPHKDSVGDNNTLFTELKAVIHTEEDYIQIQCFDDLKSAFETGQAIAAVIRFGKEHEQELLFPVKHINLQYEEQGFQVETGPVLIVPQGTCELNFIAEALPAYIVFNEYGWFEYMPFEQEKTVENQYIRSYNRKIRQEAKIELYYYKNENRGR